MRTPFPDRGRSRDDVLGALRGMKSGDVDWQHGRAPLYVFKATDAVYELGRDAFFEYFTENALGARRAFALASTGSGLSWAIAQPLRADDLQPGGYRDLGPACQPAGRDLARWATGAE